MRRAVGFLSAGVRVAGLSLGGWLAFSVPANAQAVTGTILGEVKDASHAVVAGAKVSLVHAGTGFTRTVLTDPGGAYTAPLLPTGTYSISAELAGFKKVTRLNVRLGVDQKVRIDLELSVGELAEIVDVQGGSPLIQTSSSDLSTTVESDQIEDLPLNGRNFVSLTRTVPGVLRGVPFANIDGAGGLAWRASASFSANGQRPRDNNFLLDGVDNNETWLQSVVIFPSVDALDEFKLQTSTYAAEFGKSLGGVVNLQIKSGANQLRGGAFGFLRDDALDANNFFNNRAGIAKAPFRQREFGATLGGPIRKDRTFFFADYQGLRVQQGVNRVSTVPSAAMRSGDFSEVNRTIYDPLTGQPFPGNVIPRGRWDPAAANVLDQLIPTANTAGRRSSSGQIVDNYVVNPNQEREDDQFDVKIDHTLSDANRFFVRYSFQKSHRFLPAALPQGDGFGNVDSTIKAQSVAFNDTHTFGPRWLNELRVGYSSFDLQTVPRIDSGPPLAERMGIPNVNFGAVHGHERHRLCPAGDAHPGQRPTPGHEPGEPPVSRPRDPHPGAAHLQGGGQRHLPLTGDPELGQHSRHLRLQPEPDLELRRPAGRLQGRPDQRLRPRQLPPGLRQREDPRLHRRGALHREAAGVGRLRPGRLPGELQAHPQPRPALGPLRALDRGGRSTIELRPRDRPVRGRLGSGGDRRGRGRPLLADLVEEGLRAPVRVRLRRRRRRPDDRPGRLRRLLELRPRGHVVLEGAESSVPPLGDRDHELRDPADALRRPAPAAGGRPGPGPGREHALGLPGRYTRLLCPELEPQRPAPAGPGHSRRGRLRRVERPPARAQDRPEPGPAGRGSDRPERQPALRGRVAPAPDRRYRRYLRHPRLPRPPRQVPATIRERLLVPERLHLRQDHRPRLGQRRQRDPDQRLRPRLQPRAGPLRRDAHAQLELALRAAVWPAEPARRLAGERDPVLAYRHARDDHADPDHAVDGRHGEPARPDRRRDERPIPRSSSGSTPRRSSRPRTGRAPLAPRAEASCVGRGSSTSTCRSPSRPASGASSSSCERKPSTCSITRSSPSPTPSSAAPASAASPRCWATPPAPRAGRPSGRSSSARSSASSR